ncbi:MAG: cyclic nucleotide-binding domain-containing protein [Alphaproteobacteria bacterium]|nr:cyclic nucleotide-binding domain-containing protein [Alphaproteobacteria bacterium]
MFHEGSYGFEAYIIESGLVEVTRMSEGQSRVIGTYEDNSLIGLLSIIDGQPRQNTARTLTRTSCIVLPDLYIKEKIDGAGDFISTIISLLVGRARAGERRHFRRHSIEKAVAVSLPDGSLAQHRTVDISMGGIKITPPLPPMSDAMVQVKIADLPFFPARILGSNASGSRLQFDMSGDERMMLANLIFKHSGRADEAEAGIVHFVDMEL